MQISLQEYLKKSYTEVRTVEDYQSNSLNHPSFIYLTSFFFNVTTVFRIGSIFKATGNNTKWSHDKMLIDCVRSERTGK